VDIDLTQLKGIFSAMAEAGVNEFEFEDERVRVRIGRGLPASGQPAPVYVSTMGPGPAMHDVTSTRGGAVRRTNVLPLAPSPDALGRRSSRSAQREEGQTLCIVEAMKLMNEIEAEVGGTGRRDPRRERQAGGVRPEALQAI
jgi:acetyl-CoA carboxylase biotin carboxyl carrier protein